MQQFGVRGLHRVQPLPQGGLDRGLPAGFDPDSLPQPGLGPELVPVQPGLDPAILLDLALNPLQRQEPAVQSGELALQGLQLFHRRLAPFVHRRARGLELVQQSLLPRQLGAALVQLLSHARKRLRIGRDELGAFRQRALLALLQRLQRLAGVGQMRLLHLEGLFRLGDEFALAAEPALKCSESLLGQRQPGLLLDEPEPGPF